jgi:hypothetical protein
MKERWLRDELLKEPWYFFLDQYDPNSYDDWEIEIRRKCYNKTRGEIREIEAIKKELEESYIKEGADTEVDGIWVKTKSIYNKGKENKNVINQTLSFKINHDWDKMKPYKRDIYWEEMKKIVNKYKDIRINAARVNKEKKERERKAKEETAKQKPIVIEKPNIPINREKPKPIIIEKVESKPIVISNTKCNQIVITKPTEIEKSIPKPIIIQKKETIQVINLEKKSEAIQIEEKPINNLVIQKEVIPKPNKPIPKSTPEPNPEPVPEPIPQVNIQKEESAPIEVINIEKKTEFIQFEEKPIETNAVQEMSHYKIFQQNSISQEEFIKEATFINTSKPNPNNPKQFNRWHELQLRKDCHEGYEEIDAKIIEENRKISEEIMKAIENNEIQELTEEDTG